MRGTEDFDDDSARETPLGPRLLPNIRSLLTPPRITFMFPFCSTLESRGVSRPSRTLGWNAVDALGRRTNGVGADGKIAWS